MKSPIIHTGYEKTWAFVFETGDEVPQELKEFARQQNRSDDHFTAIGAFSDVVLGISTPYC